MKPAVAMKNLGLLYLRGEGVERDEILAKLWFEKAAALGDEDAKVNLSRFEDAARAGYPTLGMQIFARRTACAQSCRAIHRTYVTSVCDKFFSGAPVEVGDRRNCIDLSLRLSHQCGGSCREWAQSFERQNPCETCYQGLIECVEETPGADGIRAKEADYSEVSRRCVLSIDNCSAACRSR